jgi:hypothetical protein
MFRYSTHKSRKAAEAALEDYFASGEVFPSEFSEIRSRRERVPPHYWSRWFYDIMLRG